MSATRKLGLEEIADLREYEREREAFRDHIIDLKRRRRIGIGTLLSLVFENRDTMRFQIQEMARAERLLSDAQIQAELDVYNALIPEPGELSATLFVELTSDEQLREWLPKLVGIERALELVIAGDVFAAVPEAAHAAMLTREHTTAAVHYVRWMLSPGLVERFAAGPVVVRSSHPAYREQTELSADHVAELLADLAP